MSEDLIILKDAEVSFPDFPEYKTKCLGLAEEIRMMDVTEENIKIVKKDLADVRKFTKSLDDRRKEIKKQILLPYTFIEKQVNELIGIVDDADKEVRSQVKQLEDAARAAKEADIRDIWNKRIVHYTIENYIPDAYSRWLLPSYLNKTTTMKTIESAMTDWLQVVQNEINEILKMEDAMDIMVDYVSTLDFVESVKRHRIREEYKEDHTEKDPEQDDEIENAIFKIEGLVNIELAERLLNEHGIKYIKY